MALDAWIEQQREAFGVPGLAVGVIQDGKIVLSQGFGSRDVAQGLPVTPDTAFAIGSATKAFTAATVGALVDDGLLEWDRPVREYIPNFQLYDHIATEAMTARDLLCHRSGLPRHDMIWGGGRDASRKEMVEILRYLQPSKPFRTTFQYNNLMFLTAGYLSEVVTGEQWEALVSRRIFERAGMSSSSFAQDSGVASEVSLPYAKRRGEVGEIPYAESLDAVGPAGSIYSSLTDMMNWLRLSLDGGRLGDSSVLSAETVKELFAPQMTMPEERLFPELVDSAYGLGWFIGNYRGHKLVHHGGNIDGFTSLVTMLPEDGIGIVILSNRNATLIRWAIALHTFDELLGLDARPWGERLLGRQEAGESGAKDAKARAHRVLDAEPSHPIESYAGTYSHPGYGTFTVSVEDGELRGSFRKFKIGIAHRHYDIFSLELEDYEDAQIYASFLTDPEGRISWLSIPLEPTVEPIVFAREPEMPPIETCERLVGAYEMGPVELTIEFKAPARLIAKIPGAGSLRLEPYDGLTFKVKGAEGVTVRFDLADGGAVREILVQPMGVFRPKGS